MMGFFSRKEPTSLDASLEKTKQSIWNRIGKAVAGKSVVDEDFLDTLEEILIASDVGVPTTIKIIKNLQARVAKDKYISAQELRQLLHDEVVRVCCSNAPADSSYRFEDRKEERLHIVLVVGVNGVGKTTTIAKLASRYKHLGKSVVLGAADTFRAAAVSQLTAWSQRVGVAVVERGMQADPASVAHDAVKEAVRLGAHVVLIDTAGRLHNKVSLMEELSKIKRTVKRTAPDALQETLLVLDGSTGQNALAQAQSFIASSEVDGLIVTKLDGTAKGGVVLGVMDQLKTPVRYVGTGERIEDLQLFDAKSFVKMLFAGSALADPSR